MSKAFHLQVGDRVAYSAAFLRSIGQYSGDLPHARGMVEAIRPLGQQQLVTIAWDREGIPSKVLQANLAKVGPNTRFCSC